MSASDELIYLGLFLTAVIFAGVGFIAGFITGFNRALTLKLKKSESPAKAE